MSQEIAEICMAVRRIEAKLDALLSSRPKERDLCTAPEKAGQTNATPAAETLNPAASGGEGWPRYWASPNGILWKAENKNDPGAWWDDRHWHQDRGESLICHTTTHSDWREITPPKPRSLARRYERTART